MRLVESGNSSTIESDLLASGQIEIICDSFDLKLIEIKSFEAAKYYSKGTQWVFATNIKHFQDRLNRFPIYVIRHRRLWFSIVPAVWGNDIHLYDENNTFFSRSKAKSIFLNFPKHIIYQMIKYDGRTISYCTNPDLTLQLAAVQQNGWAIRYIENPAPMIQWAACNQNPEAIKWITPESCIEPSLKEKYGSLLNEGIYPPSSEENQIIINNQAKIFFEDDQIKIIELKSYVAAQHYIDLIRNIEGLAVIWPFYDGFEFSAIISRGPIYLIQDKKQTDTFVKYVAFYSTTAYQHNQLRPKFLNIRCKELITLYADELFKKLPFDFIKLVLSLNGNYIRSISQPQPVELQLIAVQQYGYAINYIENPAPMIQWAACRENPVSIKYIRPTTCIEPTLRAKYGNYLTESTAYNPGDPNSQTEAEQIVYVKRNWRNIKDITNPTIPVQLAAVQQNGGAIKFITNPILEVQLAAVQQTGYAIEYITNPSLEVQLAAVQQTGDAIYFITNPSIPVQLAAVQQDGGAIQFITNPTPLIQTAACFQDPTAINWIYPIESTNVSLMKKYLDELNDERLAYLERIESESLTESINSTDPNNWTEDKQIAFVKQDYEHIKRIKNPSEAVQLAAVQQNGWAIEFITNPSLEVQLAAVQKYGPVIRFITNPTIPVQLAAVQRDGGAIQYITNPSIPVQLAAVQQNGLAIYYITNPTPLIQTAACFQNPKAINRIYPIESTNISLMNKYCDELNDERRAYLEQIENETLTESIKTPAIDDNSRSVNKWSEAKQIEFVKQNYKNIKRIKNPSEAVQLAAVQQNGGVIQYITNPCLEVQLAAVQQNGGVIQYITNPVFEVQLAAVQENGHAIRYITNPSLEVQLAAVQQNGGAIEFITNPSLEVQLAAVQQYGVVIQYIKNPDLQAQLAAVQKYGAAIYYITNPSLEVQLAAVQQDGLAIEFIIRPLPMIQAAACRQNTESINRIRPIESTNISLMKKYRDELNDERLAYLERIENETLIESKNSTDPNTWSEAEQIKHLSEDEGAAWYIESIDNPGVLVQMAAINSNALTIQCIKHPPPLIQLLALKNMFAENSPYTEYSIRCAISKINSMEETVQIYIIQTKPEFFASIRNPTKKARQLYQKQLNSQTDK